jgi:mannose-6-phosphate isomerase-like protein (cupin superfamily)
VWNEADWLRLGGDWGTVGVMRHDASKERTANMAPTSLNLTSDFVVLRPDHAATPVAVTPTLFEDLDHTFGGFTDHLLVSAFAFDTDWPTWERHPAGDELVLLLSGEATLVLQTEHGEEAVTLREPGTYVIVRKGTWHTARTSTPTRMVFITPGEGTENRPV